MIYYKKKAQQDVGATAIEYGLIASLISVLAVSGMSAVGVNLSNTYCTISKHLGGSGTCLGSSSSGTGTGNSTSGNNSGAGGTTGSPDLDSLTGKAYLNALNSSLVDDFDDNYLDSTLGGKYNNSQYHNAAFDQDQQQLLSTMNDYNKKHPSNDQITHVFGLYDPITNGPITSWAKASSVLSDGTAYSGKETVEVTTQQGHVYTIDTNDGSMTPLPPKGR